MQFHNVCYSTSGTFPTIIPPNLWFYTLQQQHQQHQHQQHQHQQHQHQHQQQHQLHRLTTHHRHLISFSFSHAQALFSPLETPVLSDERAPTHHLEIPPAPKAGPRLLLIDDWQPQPPNPQHERTPFLGAATWTWTWTWTLGSGIWMLGVA
ncbi:hypothetical protein B0T22DRAFT_282346 [Podospora appendiculata]|uniref:Uncharacterized protein n=1 Tax=Podospora appendiculata TaxID=314037 RepID=A0AAE0X0M4_9PEZI|nr:hypothetical protein B0T22DRAFT_282346 [Podospora appendiculata]